MLYTNQEDIDWNSIISSIDVTVLDKHVALMLTFVNENKIDGVILAYLRLFVSYIIM